MRHIPSLILWISLYSSALLAQPNYVDGAGREWRQLIETQGYAWNEISKVGINGCDTLTGACSGTLSGGLNVDGWIWASYDDVAQLFIGVGVSPPPPIGGGLTVEINSSWAPAMIDRDGAGPDPGYFYRTFDARPNDIIAGITRTIIMNRALAPYVLDDFAADSQDFIMNNARDPRFFSPGEGIWMYRVNEALPPIPEPTIFWLMLSAAILMRLRSRRQPT